MRLTWEDWCWLTKQGMALRHIGDQKKVATQSAGATGPGHKFYIQGLDPDNPLSGASIYDILSELYKRKGDWTHRARLLSQHLGSVEPHPNDTAAEQERLWKRVDASFERIDSLYSQWFENWKGQKAKSNWAVTPSLETLKDEQKTAFPKLITEIYNTLFELTLANINTNHQTLFSETSPTFEYFLIQTSGNDSGSSGSFCEYPLGVTGVDAVGGTLPLARISFSAEEQKDLEKRITTISGAVVGIRKEYLNPKETPTITHQDVYTKVLPFWEKYGTSVLVGAGLALCVTGILKYYGAFGASTEAPHTP